MIGILGKSAITFVGAFLLRRLFKGHGAAPKEFVADVAVPKMSAAEFSKFVQGLADVFESKAKWLGGFWSNQKIKANCEAAAKAAGIPFGVLWGVVLHESAGLPIGVYSQTLLHPDASAAAAKAAGKNSSAYGIGGMTRSAFPLAVKAGNLAFKFTDLWSPDMAAQASAWLLRSLFETRTKSWRRALTAYAGAGNAASMLVSVGKQGVDVT